MNLPRTFKFKWINDDYDRVYWAINYQGEKINNNNLIDK